MSRKIEIEQYANKAAEIYEALIHMAEALDGAALHIDTLVDDEEATLPSWARYQMSGATSSLKCFSVLCSNLSANSENLRDWILKQGSDHT